MELSKDTWSCLPKGCKMKRVNVKNKKDKRKGINASKCKGLPPFFLHEDFKKKFPELFPKGSIYHYTSAEVLCKLTEESASFYATHYSALNDDAEYEKGIKYALEEYLPKCQKPLHRLLKREFPKLYETGSDGTGSQFLYVPWVTSFSLEKDLLSQWIAYTPQKDGGVAIGFDFEKMERAIRTSVCVRRKRSETDADALSYEIHFLPCVYLEPNSENIRKTLDYLFNEYWPKFYNASLMASKKLNHCKAKAITALLVVNLFGAIAKDVSFANEKEFRIIMLVKDESFLKKMELVGGKPRLKVPIEEETKLKINKLISSVTVSPHGDKRLLRSIVDFARHREGLSFDVFESKSPYCCR